jgi:hypothetical protein
MSEPNLLEFLPLRRRALLRSAIGRTLEQVDRLLVTTPDDFVDRGGPPMGFFAQASGPVELLFSGGLVHALSTWPSQLSVLVEPDKLGPDPYAVRYRLSASQQVAPAWLVSALGATVDAVRVWVYRDDVPSDEARQAAVSYVLGTGLELFYCTYLHGRMDGDELVRREDLPAELPADPIDVGDEAD